MNVSAVPTRDFFDGNFYYSIISSINLKIISPIDRATYSGIKTIPDTYTVNGIKYNITEIDNGAFSGCTGLKEIRFNQKIKKIPLNAFNGCTGLTTIVFSDKITQIGESAFQGCTRLESITFSESLTSIGKNSFKGCTKISTLKLPFSLQSLGEGAFQNCSNLRSLRIYENCNTFGIHMFCGCTSLSNIYSYNSTPADFCTKSEENQYLHCYFDDATYNTCALRVPIGLQNTYRSRYGWRKFKNIYETISGIQEITTESDAIRISSSTSRTIRVNGLLGKETISCYDLKGVLLKQCDAAGQEANLTLDVPSGTVILVKVNDRTKKVILL